MSHLSKQIGEPGGVQAGVGMSVHVHVMVERMFEPFSCFSVSLRFCLTFSHCYSQ